MKSSSGLIYSPPDKMVEGTSVQAADEVRPSPKNNPQTLNDNFISAEELLVSHTHVTAPTRGQAPPSEIWGGIQREESGQLSKRSQRAKKNSPLLPVLSGSSPRWHEVLFRAKHQNQTINRPPTGINSALSGSLSWHVLEKRLPLLGHKRPFPPNLGDTCV